jgi:hypothetical protein
MEEFIPMDTLEQVDHLLTDADEYHKNLIYKARAVAKFRDLLLFISECVAFAKKYFPEEITQPWLENDDQFPILTNRSLLILSEQDPDQINLDLISSTGGTISSSSFSFLTSHYNYLETKQGRSEYSWLAEQYKGLLNSEEDQESVFIFVSPISKVAAAKYKQGIREFQSLPFDEDPQGPVMALRSAIDLLLDELIDLTPLTKKEKSSLKAVSTLPTIAEYLAKNEEAKVDIILANDQLQELWKQLSATKGKHFPKEVAGAYVSQVTAFLTLLANTLRTSDN